MFFSNDLCKHSCKDCLSTRLKIGKYSCFHCGVKINNIEKIGKETEKCSVCNVKRYVIGDYMIHFCDNHSHCYNCMMNALIKQECGKCNRSLIKADIFKVQKRAQIYEKNGNSCTRDNT